MAYRFGKGEKTCAVVGALRGDEVQQLYVCARLVSFLRGVEKEDGVQPGKSVMIVPTVIGASMNEAIFLDGKEVNFRSSREALDNGVAMVHQELNLSLIHICPLSSTFTNSTLMRSGKSA